MSYTKDIYEQVTCPSCGEQSSRPVPALFSFNSPLGACSLCQGFGRVVGIDRERVVPDPSKSLHERPIAPWNSPAYEALYEPLFLACAEHGIPLDVPWADLDPTQQQWVWSGKGSFKSLDKFFARLERRNYRIHVRVLLARYRAYDECADCGGGRLKPSALRVHLDGKNISQLSAWSISTLTPVSSRTPLG